MVEFTGEDHLKYVHDSNFVLVKAAIMHLFQMDLPRNVYRGDPMTATISNLRNVMNVTSKNKGTPEMHSA